MLSFRQSLSLTPACFLATLSPQHPSGYCKTHTEKVPDKKLGLGPIRTSGQVLNVITFLTKTKLSRQVRDILKKTKDVIISTIALHMLLASSYISQHGRLVQTSNNQADPRGENF